MDCNEPGVGTHAPTVVDLIPDDILKEWDKWNFSVIGPMGLDDLAQITVILRNQNGSRIDVTISVV